MKYGPPPKKKESIYRIYFWVGLLGLVFGIGSFIASLYGIVSDLIGFLGIASVLLWIVVLTIGIIGAVSVEESKQSVSQIFAMIMGAGR